MKHCMRCGTDKDASSFNRNKSKRDGLADWCRECMRAYLAAYTATPHARARQRERFQSRYKTDAAFRARVAHRQRENIARRGPAYQAAHNAVYRAIEAGRMTRPSQCSRCPATDNIEAHHDDHARPLDVMWLCPVCHAARHRELGRLRTAAKMYGNNPDLGF
jgi:hypothetical protein